MGCQALVVAGAAVRETSVAIAVERTVFGPAPSAADREAHAGRDMTSSECSRGRRPSLAPPANSPPASTTLRRGGRGWRGGGGSTTVDVWLAGDRGSQAARSLGHLPVKALIQGRSGAAWLPGGWFVDGAAVRVDDGIGELAVAEQLAALSRDVGLEVSRVDEQPRRATSTVDHRT